MLDGNYKNLKVSKSFENMLNEMSNSNVLTEELKSAGKELSKKINEPTYADSRHRDILECFRSNASHDDRYNQELFSMFESYIVSCS